MGQCVCIHLRKYILDKELVKSLRQGSNYFLTLAKDAQKAPAQTFTSRDDRNSGAHINLKRRGDSESSKSNEWKTTDSTGEVKVSIPSVEEDPLRQLAQELSGWTCAEISQLLKDTALRSARVGRRCISTNELRQSVREGKCYESSAKTASHHNTKGAENTENLGRTSES